MKICENCNQLYHDETNFCPSCGKELKLYENEKCETIDEEEKGNGYVDLLKLFVIWVALLGITGWIASVSDITLPFIIVVFFSYHFYLLGN